MAKGFYNQKIKRFDKLSRSQKEDFLADLLVAFRVIHNPEEVALFVRDLFTRAEVSFFAKRLRIAKLLLAGKTYYEVGQEVHASYGTVAKVAMWLREKGEGFRRVIKKLPPKRDAQGYPDPLSEWEKIKRKYPSRFWPFLMLEEMERSSISRRSERLNELLKELEDKRELHQELEQQYAESHKRRKR